MKRSWALAVGLWALGLAVPDAVLAQIAMPDASAMAGRAIPASELPDGTISVRLVREALGNNIPGHEVTVVAGDAKRSGRTDESGRAQITGLPAGASATAEAAVDGERIVSLPFQVPARGGVRVILIAGLQQAQARRAAEAAEAAQAPPVKGSVVFGADSRLIFEFQNDRLSVFYLLDIVNTARTRVDTGGPLILALPSGAGGARVLEGSFAGATAQGDRVTIVGPFPPGTSSVQVGFQLLYSGHAVSVAQTFPAPLQAITVFAEKVGSLAVSSGQFTNTGEVKAGDGTVFVSGSGGALPAGGTLTVHLTGLPHESAAARNIALVLAAIVVGIGAWLAFGARGGNADRRRLAAQRESLLKELAKVEQQHRSGRMDDDRYDARRRQLVSDLERIYGELDDRPGEGGGAAA